jgi:hypothetical protein
VWPNSNGFDNCFFAGFLGARLDHHDAVGRADDHDVDRAAAHLVICRIDDELVVDHSDAHCTDRTEERNVRQRQCGRRRVNAENVRIIITIRGQHERNHLRLTLKSLGKHRSYWAVDLAAGEHFALTHAAFALDEAAGKTSAGVGVLAIVHGEGKEVDAFAGIGIGGGGGEHNVLSEADNGRSSGLLGQLSSFK